MDSLPHSPCLPQLYGELRSHSHSAVPLPTCPSLDNIQYGSVWAPTLPENQPEKTSDDKHARSPSAKHRGVCRAPATLSLPVLIATHGNTGSPTENHSQKHQPSSPCPIQLLRFHSLFLLLSPITPSLPHNPRQQTSPPNFGLTQPTVIFQANCNCNQLSLFPWGYFNLYKSIISYHDQPAIHLLSKY